MIGFAQKGAEYFVNKIFPQELTNIKEKPLQNEVQRKIINTHKKIEQHKTTSRTSKKENSYPKLNVVRKKLGEVCNKEKCIEMYEYTYTTCSKFNCKSSVKKVKKVRIINSKNDNKLSTI